jgi:hypothetical protein
MEINKGIYGLPQGGILAQDRLVKHLAEHGYHQARNTPCLFKHESNSVSFTLVVDDFMIKYKDKSDADHLMQTLRKLYKITEDWAAEQKYVGITFSHDLTKNKITMSMPGYVNKAIERFRAQDIPEAKSPGIYIPPTYGQAAQTVIEPSEKDKKPLSAKQKTFIQEVVGVFLFYSRAVDPTMLTQINKISSEQANPTEATMTAVKRFLGYAKRFPNAEIVIHASNMQLCVQSDASYLSESKARSRSGGILYFGLTAEGTINGAIDYISTILPTVVASVAEAEYASLFTVGKEAISARHTLEDLGHSQRATVIMCDNSCAVGISNATVKQKRSKAIDMRYHWIRDQVKQGTFTITWEQGSANLADYFTKTLSVKNFTAMRRTYVSTPTSDTIRNTARSRRIAKRNSKQTP